MREAIEFGSAQVVGSLFLSKHGNAHRSGRFGSFVTASFSGTIGYYHLHLEIFGTELYAAIQMRPGIQQLSMALFSLSIKSLFGN